MSWAYAIALGMVAAMAGFLAVVLSGFSLLGMLASAYVCLSLMLVAIAYAGVGPAMLGKNSSGRLTWWAWLLFAPYRVLCHGAFWLARLLESGPAFVQVDESLFLGRQPIGSEARSACWGAVLDLTVEWAEVPSLRLPGAYRLLPVLDGTAPAPEPLTEAVAWLRARARQGTVLVHCALGHGRSACVVVAYLLAEGKHSTPREAEAYLRRLRPGVRLNAAQRRAILSIVRNQPIPDDP